jgi:hypothetical protein
MYRKLTLLIAFSAIPLFLIVFSLAPRAAQATSRNRPQDGQSKIELPSGVPSLALQSAASRKDHGSGIFDIDMPLSATLNGSDSGIETRLGGDVNGLLPGEYIIVLTFNNSITGAGTATVTDHNPTGAGGVAGTAAIGTPDTEVIVPLSGVDNEQVLTLHLEDVTDGTDTIDVDVNIGFLIGDTTNTRTVNASDVSQTKSFSGTAVTTSALARIDVNVSGIINASDTVVVKASSGTAAP